MAKTPDQTETIAKAYGFREPSKKGVTENADFRITLSPQQKARIERERARIEQRYAAGG